MDQNVQVEEATSKAELLTQLGYSIADNLLSDVIVLCEGPHDKPVLDEFFLKIGLDRSVIKVRLLGGDIMDKQDLSVFAGSSNVVALIDRDPKSDPRIRKSFAENCHELGIKITPLTRYSLENYFSMTAVRAVFRGVPEGIEALDPDKKVSQLGVDVKRAGGRIAQLMNLEDIRGTDLYAFLETVANLAKSQKQTA
jgi:hypothetical protein